MQTKTGFENLGIPSMLAEKLKKENILSPTEVQSKAIPYILEGKDVIGQSPTGTGKTLAYLLPLLTRVNPENKTLQVLVLAPTRELAVQVNKVANELGNDLGILSIPVLGGVNIHRQVDSLKKKPQIIVGTPGRVLELLRMRKINAQTIKSVVVDEFDKMWQMGFKEDVQAVIKATLRERQVVMVSATVSPELVASAIGLLNDPEMVNISQDKQTAGTIKHIYFMTQEKNKAEMLKKLIDIYKPRKAIVFINSNKGVIPFARRFRDFGMSAEGLHSELNPQERKTVLEKFRSGKARFLVTTDLFARGMDIKDVEIVFNLDIPINSEYYIHRVGRTGRAGASGLAVNFVTPEQKFIMPKYEKQLDISIEEWAVSGEKVFPLRKRHTRTADTVQKRPGHRITTIKPEKHDKKDKARV